MHGLKTFFLKYRLRGSFFLILTLLFFFLGYNDLLSTGPMSIHGWRQSDSYSFALSYFNENNQLLEPSILFIGEDGNSKTVSEFPILYYITAKIWKITGVTPAVLKFINFLLLLTGLFHLLMLSGKVLKDNFWSMFVVLFLFSSPIIGYYGFNFIPNIPAFGLALTGLYYLYKFVSGGKTTDLIIFSLVFILASLIKVTALISLLGASFVAFTYYFSSLRTRLKNFIKFSLAVLFIFFCYWRWYVFAGQYNQDNLQNIFNQSTIPIWELSKERILDILDKFYFNVFPQYFNSYAMYAILLIIAAMVVFRKAFNPYARRTGLIYFLGTISFMILFFQGLDVHDYFLINTLVFIPAATITVLLTFKKISPKYFQSRSIKILGAIILIFLINKEMILVRSHYNADSKLVNYNIPLSKREQDFWDYKNYMLQLTDLQYQGMDKYLRKIGINYNDKVISVGDGTPNLTLSLMGVKGFSEYHYRNIYSEKEKIERMIILGAKYIVINKHNELGEETKSFLGEKVGQYNDISIYSIKKDEDMY